jgi:hypothetical protein
VGDELSVREAAYQDGKIIESRPNAATIITTKIDRFESFHDMLGRLGSAAFSA